MSFWRFGCLFFYYLGDACYRLDFYLLYNFFMSKSIDISEKYKLDIWKEVGHDVEKIDNEHIRS